ncbi:MAG: aspartate kinase [Candidatus Bathyarchaeota archaeon]|nr:aspartate kinase [Candidatus Bathyarchaeota archaeon]MDH5623751.1 aspartate kinase [Candidatus Bathyarchaeota archaeon]
MKQSGEESCKRIVVKYGGASLADHERLLKAVTAVAKEARKGTQIAVIVSAMGKTTDQLLHAAKNASNGNVEKKELDEILAMGERTSIRIFAVALKSQGVESRYFDPLDPDWPIITDDVFSDANPILNKCEERVQRYVLPLVEKGVIPIIAGFVGRTHDKRTTTLGRGGSDTTAFILAKALAADELILVTDAEGIMSADPKIISKPERLPSIDVNTLVGIADSGTKFIHRKALRYKDSSVKVRVISHIHGDLNAKGTLIKGALSTELDVALASQSPTMSITVVGRGVSEKPEVIQELTEKVKAHAHLLGLSLNYDSIILYAPENEDSNLLLEKVHETILEHEETLAMSVRKQLAFLKVKGVDLEETPGLIGKISETLRLNAINIFGLLTITSSILLFVDWSKKERALNLVRNALRGD